MNADRYALLWANGMKFRDVLDVYAHDLAEEIRNYDRARHTHMLYEEAADLIDPEMTE